ncbi:DUF2059 domain-containing protein [Chelativorans sp. YIM 93263]|uniref:DUF2059 domain-containing protein n=1 Tax=Chelativorans sp. YIM 93263 TaxID=2906648 RepID=UPI0023792894|nr:DUF2059 domain-containing protein [Chelativorans sp. YIM 93263]
MTLAKRARLAVFAIGVSFAAVSLPAGAQDVSDSHLQAARAAVDAIEATTRYDEILPDAAQRLKSELIQQNPNMVDVIESTVNEQALELAGRRGDLETEAALAYAQVFSEDELNQIAEFYNSPAGQKLLSDGPIVTREVREAAEIWRRGVIRDLSAGVGEKLQPEAGVEPSDEDGEG